MPYIGDIENDVFISYSHVDNQPLTEGQRGWISDFHHALQVRLTQLLGEELAIWRDAKLSGIDHFDDVLTSKLRKTAVLVSVLSPRYLHSTYCMKELREFFESTEASSSASIQDKSRVFKVIKTHVPREQHPRELQGLLGYEFYRIDEMTGRPREFSLDPQYWAKLEDLAYDIHALLKALRGSSGPANPTATVFLAETTSDLTAERDKIKRELQERGCMILPSKPLPLNAADLDAVVRENLERCRLSIHLTGKNYGIVPEDETRSMVCLQNESVRRWKPANFSQVIWIPEGLQVTDVRQREYLESLRTGTAASSEVELLETSLEELNACIQDKLTAKPKAEPPGDSRKGPARIYILCDPRDLEAVRPLEEWLFAEHCEALLSAIDGDETELREYHRENLVTCDAAIIYYGSASEVWVRAKLTDLKKAYGYGRASDKEMTAAIYLASPETAQKNRFRTLEIKDVIRSFGEFSPDPLEPFLSRVRALQ